MNVGVINGLSGCVAIIHANVETADGSIFRYYLGSKLIEQLVYRAPLRLE
jgi:hypothetical protein